MPTTTNNPTVVITSPLDDAARDTTGAALQSALTDLVDLGLVAKQAHWNVVGERFKIVHEHLDELVDLARENADEVAERAAALGVSPDGRATTVAATSGVPAFDEGWRQDRDVVAAIVAILDTVAARMRQRVEITDKTDLVTQDLLIGITAALEKARWMWQAQTA